MYEITVAGSFSSAHALTGYKGDCERLHGHNWTVEVCMCSKKLDKAGMVIDFQQIKEVISMLDHTKLNDRFTKCNPTAENIAEWIAMSLQELANEQENKPNIVYVMVEESPGNKAILQMR